MAIFKSTQRWLIGLTLPIFAISCATTPEEPVEEVIILPPVQTCVSINELEKVVVPAVTRSGYQISTIESPSEYYTDPDTGEVIEIKNPPIERREPYTVIVEPEYFYYRNAAGEQVTDICEIEAAPN